MVDILGIPVDDVSFLYQGNKLTMLSENMTASWVILTELNACK